MENPEKEGKNDTASPSEEIPYPESDLSPAAQRTIKRKIESGEDEGVEKDDFLRLLGKATESRECDPEE